MRAQPVLLRTRSRDYSLSTASVVLLTCEATRRARSKRAAGGSEGAYQCGIIIIIIIIIIVMFITTTITITIISISISIIMMVKLLLLEVMGEGQQTSGPAGRQHRELNCCFELLFVTY